MKQSLLAFLVISVLASSAGAGNRVPPTSTSEPTTPYAPGVVYIKLKAGSTAIEQYRHLGIIAQSAGVSGTFARVLDELRSNSALPFDPDAPKDAITHDLGIDRMYVIYYSNRAIDPRHALEMLIGTGEVECGSVRYLFPLSLTPNDPSISSQYALTNMHLFKAWDVTIGDSTVLIADVDDGFNVGHEDLKNAIKVGWDLVGNVDPTAGEAFQPDNDPRPDYIGSTHGSHTSGCIAATGNNHVGITGTAFGCRLLAIKAAGNESTSSIDAGYEGIHYASTHGARVINCSWGGPIAGTDVALANTLIQEALSRNALVVCAAGNSGTSNDKTPFYPANAPGVLSVGATDQTDAPAFYSNYGNTVNVWAPGSGIYSCTYPGTNVYNAEDGTSFSSPLTAGVAGLLVSQHPSWPPHFIARQIIQTCENVVMPADQFDFWGLVDADSALRTAPLPGLIVTGYSLDGIASDSLRAIGTAHAFVVTFKNVTAAGTGITAKMIKGTGYTGPSSSVALGSVGLDASVQGNFQITRNGVFSEGNLPVKFYLTDGVSYEDTVTMYIPLQRQPGFVVERIAPSGSSLKRVSHTAAWASFGDEVQPQAGVFVVAVADYARETGGGWTDTAALWDRSQAPYDVDALDSMSAWFGTGPRNGDPPSVIRTTDGGKSFAQSDASAFTLFVNSVHFFTAINGAPLDGIIIGDPASTTSISTWGIGITADGGRTWSLSATAPNNLKAGEASWNNGTVWVGDNGWFGSNSSRIWHTTNRGQTWSHAVTTLVNSFSIAVDDDLLHGFACFRKTASSGGGTSGTNGMNKTTNGGQTWTAMAMPVTSMVPGAVAFVPNSHAAIVSSDSGIFRTTDFGTTWTPIGFPIGYDAANAQSLSVFRGQGKLTVSMITSGTGIATYAEAMADPVQGGVTATPGPAAMDLTISPNPFQQDVSISFSLAERQHVRLVVLDGLGREVAIVLNDEEGPALQSATFHAGALPAGVYYVLLQSDRGSAQTRAISLVR